MSCSGVASGQSLTSPRATALGAFGAVVDDSRNFVANPAGLAGVIDWEFNAAAYLSAVGGNTGAVFHGLTLAKRIHRHHALGLQFSDGTFQEFVLPGQAVIVGQDPASVDRTITYSEPLSFGYVYTPIPQLSIGGAVRFRREKVVDTQYQLMDTAITRLPDAVYEDDAWMADLGILLRPGERLNLSLLGRNLLAGSPSQFPADLEEYHLDRDASLEIGVAWSAIPSLLLALQGSTTGSGAAGLEWNAGESMALRTGLYMSDSETQFVYAFGAGLGWTYEFFDIDASYLGFFDQSTHAGGVPADRFDPSLISMIDLNPYTTPRISVDLTARFGQIYQSPVQIDGVKILSPVFPAFSDHLAYTPIATAFVTNIDLEPVQVRATFFVDDIMDAPTESGPVFIAPGQQVEIPLVALFNSSRLKAIQGPELREATVSVTPERGEHRNAEESRVRVLIQGRNAWDGDASSLRYFVTPEDSAVVRFTREILYRNRAELDGVPQHLIRFHKARLIIDAFSGDLVYVNDPRTTSDVVQYPGETLRLQGGDCDDMTVCFASLLSSIGIPTAFVDVVPPDDPAKSHIYLLFDTGVPPASGAEIADNRKRFVVRQGDGGEETLWVPMETTVIMKGFEEAWKAGADEYLEDVEINLGVARGWVRIVDVR
jgi:hypothetical protein